MRAFCVFVPVLIFLISGRSIAASDTAAANLSGNLTVAAVKQISAGGAHTCVLTSSGGVKCWGKNDLGQLGIGTNSGPESCRNDFACSTVPVDVNELSGVVSSIEAGDSHACALLTNGGLKCWGYNYYGQLGNSTNSGMENCHDQPCSTVPVDVRGIF